MNVAALLPSSLERVDHGAYTMVEFMERFRVGRTTFYREIKAGRLRSYTLGRRRFVSYGAASEWLSALEAAGSYQV